jgi:hypothetical protein
MDASLTGLGGVLSNYVYELSIDHKPDYCIAHWEAINILVAIRTFSSFILHSKVTIWCDNMVAVSILNSGRGRDPILHSIARNLWLWAAALDCDITFSHVRGIHNRTADLLSRWQFSNNQTATLFSLLNAVPIWLVPPADALTLDLSI